MQGLHIRTDHKWHPFKYGYEVPKSVLRRDFDWLDEEEQESGTFIKHHGYWYHLSQFTRTDGALKELGWTGIINDSFSSGVLIDISRDGEEYQIATYYVQS